MEKSYYELFEELLLYGDELLAEHRGRDPQVLIEAYRNKIRGVMFEALDIERAHLYHGNATGRQVTH